MTRRPKPKIIIDMTFTRHRRHSCSNLTPGSIHYLIPPPEGESDNFQDGGVWVNGVSKPIKLFFGEFWIHWESVRRNK